MALMDTLAKTDQEMKEAIDRELSRQRNKLELIASENIVSRAVMEAQGSVLTNKYAEGYPGKRYYGGCECVDVVEQIAIDRAKKVFGAAYANVQPHSGAQANMAVFFALLTPGDTVMGLSLTDGGHLTHGSPVNMSGMYFKIVPYGVSAETETIDYDALEKQVLETKPKMIVAGASAYARIIDFPRLSEIAKKAGAYLMVDIAHIAGLVAAGLHPNPLPYADVVTTTTHKTLRGPRGGLILTNDEELGKKFNKAIFPGIQGGPLMHVIAAKAVALGEALKPEFKEYQKQVLKNERMCVLFVAYDGEVRARFYVEYVLLRSFETRAEKLRKLGVTTEIRTFDPCLTPAYFSRISYLPDEAVKIRRMTTSDVDRETVRRAETGMFALGSLATMLDALHAFRRYVVARGWLGFFKFAQFLIGAAISAFLLIRYPGTPIPAWASALYGLVLILLSIGHGVSAEKRIAEGMKLARKQERK